MSVRKKINHKENWLLDPQHTAKTVYVEERRVSSLFGFFYFDVIVYCYNEYDYEQIRGCN